MAHGCLTGDTTRRRVIPSSPHYLAAPHCLEPVLRLIVPLMLCIPATLTAQLAPLGVPSGVARMEVYGDFAWANDRYRDGTRESLAAPLTSPALGEAAIPTLADADRRIGVMIGVTGYQLNLGRSTGSGQSSRGTGEVGLALGVLRQLALFGRMEIVNSWNRQDLGIAAETGDAGVNPADPAMGTSAGADAAQVFVTNFNNAMAELETRLASGSYDGDPATRALAEQTLASGRQLSDSLAAVLVDPATVAAFLPLASSFAGTTLNGRVTAMQGTLSGPLGVAGFTEQVPLPLDAATSDDIHRYATAAAGPIAYEEFTEKRMFLPGDVSLGAVFTPVDRWDPVRGAGVRVALQGTLRLATGTPASANDALGTSTGPGTQTVVALGAVDLGGGLVGARLAAGYTAHLAGTFERRVGAPAEALVPVARLATVRQSGGNEWRVSVAPHLRVAKFFGLQATGSWATRSAREFSYASTADSVPGIPASLLAEGTGASRLELGVGAIYSSGGTRPDGTPYRAVDAGWMWRTIVASSGGIQTRWSGMQFFFRYYAKFW